MRRTCRYLDQKSGFFWFWSSPKVGENLFVGDHLNSAGKTLCISVKTFIFFIFFGDHPILTAKQPQSNSRPMKIWVNFVYGCIKLPKKPPPLYEILATRLWQSTIYYNDIRKGGCESRLRICYSARWLSLVLQLMFLPQCY